MEVGFALMLQLLEPGEFTETNPQSPKAVLPTESVTVTVPFFRPLEEY